MFIAAASLVEIIEKLAQLIYETEVRRRTRGVREAEHIIKIPLSGNLDVHCRVKFIDGS